MNFFIVYKTPNRQKRKQTERNVTFHTFVYVKITEHVERTEQVLRI